MDFDAGDALAGGNGLIVEQTQAGRADERNLAPHLFGVDASVQYVGRRNKSIFVVQAEMHPHGPVRVGRNEDVADADARHAIRFADRDESGDLGRDAQDLNGQGRGQHVIDGCQQRNPAHDASAWIDAQQPVAAGGSVQLFQTAQRSGEMPQMRGRVAPANSKRRGAAVGDGRPFLLNPGDAERHGMPAQRIRQHGVVARQLRQALGELQIQPFDQAGDAGRRHAVGFRHQHVHADRRGFVLRDRFDQIRDGCARPRPLAEFLQAFFVDGNDDRGSRGALARRHFLVSVEQSHAQLAQGRQRREQRKREQDDEQCHAQRPALAADQYRAQIVRGAFFRRVHPGILAGFGQTSISMPS